MQNYLIIGGSGYLGAEIARQMKPHGNVYTTYCNSPNPEGVKFDFFEGEIWRFVADHKISTVIFAAAVARSREGIDWDYNDAVERFVTEFVGTGIKLVFVSTDAVFSGDKGSYTESDFPNSRTDYGSNVGVFESFIEHLLNIWAVIRVSYLYGDTETHRDRRLEEARKLVENGQKFERAENIFKSPVHVTDAAKHIAGIATKRLGGFFHIPGKRMSIYEFYKERFEAENLPCDLLVPNIAPVDAGIPVDTSLKSERLIDGSGDS